MNKQIEALKMAIEGMAKAEKVFDDLGLLLIKFGVNPSDINFHKESFLAPVIQVCKKALAEAEKQEPVAEVIEDKLADWSKPHVAVKWNKVDFKIGTKFYTHPAPSWQSLSDDEIAELNPHCYADELDLDFARAIEQALKEKNI